MIGKKCGTLQRRSLSLALRAKKGSLRRSRRKINAKLHARDNSHDPFISFSLEPTISSKISPKVLIVISYLPGFGLLEKPLQFLKFSER